MKPKISIIIPTHKTDYCQQMFLKDVLLSIIHSYGFDNSVEIIVVENPSKTQEVVDIIKFCCHNRRFNIIHTESGLGANRARNTGIRMASSDIIALIDDDCLVERGWINSIIAAHQIYPGVGVIGGSMKLIFKDRKPRWIDGYFTNMLAQVDHGDQVIDFSWDKDRTSGMIVSGNLSFKRAIYDKTSGFNEAVGYVGNNYMSQDEIEFIYECTQLGSPAKLYIGSAIVYHHIPASRLNIDYFIKKSYGDGYNYAKMVCGTKEFSDMFIEDFITIYLLPKWNQYLNHHDLSEIRQKISHEESTRLYIRNIIRCRIAYFSGVEDYFKTISDRSYTSNNKLIFIDSVSTP